MRVVFDTNIYVSAFALPGGRAERAFRDVVEGRHELVVSKAIIDETLGILARKFGRDAEHLAATAVLMADVGELVEPDFTLSVLADEPDNRILECAVAGCARRVVTGDKAMLAIGEHDGIVVVSLGSWLAEVHGG